MIFQIIYIILIFISIILFAIFHQLASRSIINSSELRRLLYGFDLYENRSMDISNIQSIIIVIIVINMQYIFYAKKHGRSSLFEKRKVILFSNLNSEIAFFIVQEYKKLWIYIKWSIVFGMFSLLSAYFFVFQALLS
ncbi:hypothetical protein VH98_10465 [Acinetobacter brisouii]|nr:hypothetical protein VH98_10465 [Acinetobacter brisouii]